MSDEIYVVAREIDTETTQTNKVILKGDYINAGVHKKHINEELTAQWINISYAPDDPFSDCILMIAYDKHQVQDMINVLQAALKEMER